MGQSAGRIQGILAFITTDKDRYLGGAPLSILARDKDEVVEFSEAIAEAFLADILELKSGDYLIIKK
ncbi:hypothetical protein BKP45_13290 [Anaerobacillus alkalidiazotrophicus]|uniref:Uncharacterized protein n=1 Tax=Anaerobacillus alkalidiazotrophicus TaxID=472963 RepID=A0A1S2M6W7_9BACI|nr:hypothetical protein [Anaerobacillus alkalidiazotrophicus]OIJ19415.1 hypothetical protein BKP45_13290 [Anaerobacillus alkalidiazotrophicus]